AGWRPCSTGRRRYTGSDVPGTPGGTAPRRNELGGGQVPAVRPRDSGRGAGAYRHGGGASRTSAAGAVTGTTVERAITRAHHEEWARVVASLARRFGDLDVAEEATAEAFLVAAERWPREGVPPNPG